MHCSSTPASNRSRIPMASPYIFLRPNINHFSFQRSLSVSLPRPPLMLPLKKEALPLLSLLPSSHDQDHSAGCYNHQQLKLHEEVMEDVAIKLQIGPPAPSSPSHRSISQSLLSKLMMMAITRRKKAKSQDQRKVLPLMMATAHSTWPPGSSPRASIGSPAQLRSSSAPRTTWNQDTFLGYNRWT
jgi:hypothetical protein